MAKKTTIGANSGLNTEQKEETKLQTPQAGSEEAQAVPEEKKDSEEAQAGSTEETQAGSEEKKDSEEAQAGSEEKKDSEEEKKDSEEEKKDSEEAQAGSEEKKDSEEAQAGSEEKKDSEEAQAGSEPLTTLDKIKEFLKRNSYNHLSCGKYLQGELTREKLKKFYSEFLVYISSADDFKFQTLLEDYFDEQ